MRVQRYALFPVRQVFGNKKVYNTKNSITFAPQLRKDRNVAQLVAHYVRDVGVGRSSRLIPTKKWEPLGSHFFVGMRQVLFLFCYAKALPLVAWRPTRPLSLAYSLRPNTFSPALHRFIFSFCSFCRESRWAE